MNSASCTRLTLMLLRRCVQSAQRRKHCPTHRVCDPALCPRCRSFAVTMWEVFSNAAEPYASRTDQEVSPGVHSLGSGRAAQHGFPVSLSKPELIWHAANHSCR